MFQNDSPVPGDDCCRVCSSDTRGSDHCPECGNECYNEQDGPFVSCVVCGQRSGQRCSTGCSNSVHRWRFNDQWVVRVVKERRSHV